MSRIPQSFVKSIVVSILFTFFLPSLVYATPPLVPGTISGPSFVDIVSSIINITSLVLLSGLFLIFSYSLFAMYRFFYFRKRDSSVSFLWKERMLRGVPAILAVIAFGLMFIFNNFSVLFFAPLFTISAILLWRRGFLMKKHIDNESLKVVGKMHIYFGIYYLLTVALLSVRALISYIQMRGGDFL